MEASTLLHDTNSIGIGGNSNEDGLGEHYGDKVSPYADPVVHMSVSEAEKRLKRIESDYQHTYKNLRINEYYSYRYYYEHSHYGPSKQSEFCIRYYKDIRQHLQNDLEKLNNAEAMQRRTEKPDYCKQFSILHGCKNLAQEKRILHQIRETQEQQQKQLENKEMGQKITYPTETRNYKISQFSYTQSKVPKSSSSNGIHDLLRSLKDTMKLMNKATANGDKPTSQDSLTISIQILTKIIKKLEKEPWKGGWIYFIDYEKKIKHLEKKCELICGQWDEQKKCIAELKKLHEDGLN